MADMYSNTGLGGTVLSNNVDELRRYYTDPYNLNSKPQDLSTFNVSRYTNSPTPVSAELDSTLPAMPEDTGAPDKWVRNTSVLGTLGLGLASFLESRKTANLQRQALRDDISTAREHRANRQALGESWNKAWSS